MYQVLDVENKIKEKILANDSFVTIYIIYEREYFVNCKANKIQLVCIAIRTVLSEGLSFGKLLIVGCFRSVSGGRGGGGRSFGNIRYTNLIASICMISKLRIYIKI